MSDDAPADDSGFDKEAEREKLREKFARDERKRESTRQMSELLLKGATMTNAHCDDCGSPIFRQNGQEFCPQCDTGGDAANEGAAGQAGQAGEAGQPGQAGRSGQASPERPGPDVAGAAGDAGDAVEVDAADASATDAGPQDGRADTHDVASDGTRTETPARVPTDAPSTSPPAASPANGHANATSAGDGVAPSAPAGGDDLPAARDALARALRRHAEAGAEATDPHTASAHLEAAREAAEALAALRR